MNINACWNILKNDSDFMLIIPTSVGILGIGMFDLKARPNREYINVQECQYGYNSICVEVCLMKKNPF